MDRIGLLVVDHKRGGCLEFAVVQELHLVLEFGLGGRQMGFGVVREQVAPMGNAGVIVVEENRGMFQSEILRNRFGVDGRADDAEIREIEVDEAVVGDRNRIDARRSLAVGDAVLRVAAFDLVGIDGGFMAANGIKAFPMEDGG